MNIVESVAMSRSLPDSVNAGEKALNILFADDDPANQWVITYFLESAGCVVQAANNGKTAVELFCSQVFDLVLMDMQMPVMDGLEAISHIRMYEKERGGARVPIIAMTVFTANEDKKIRMVEGVDECLPKPVNKEELLKLIQDLLPADRKLQRMPEEGGDGGGGKNDRQDRAEPEKTDDGKNCTEKEFIQRKVARIFLDTYKEQILDIRKAIVEENGKMLELAAHSLRGALALLGDNSALDVAYKLEKIGKENNMDSAYETFRELEAEIECLKEALGGLVEKGTRKKRALIVDDSKAQCEFLCELLRENGYWVDVEANGSRAIYRAAEKKYDLITLDLHLPRIDGFEVLAELKKSGNSRNTPVIMLTIDKSPEVAELSRRYGACEFLTKPVDPGKFIEKAAYWIRKAQKEEDLLNNKVSGFSEKKTKVSDAPKKTGGKNPKILVVEDNQAQRGIILDFLKGITCHSDMAKDGREALELISRNSYDLIVLDLHMPSMNGFEFLRQLKSGSKKEKVLVITVDGSMETIKKTVGMGICDFLLKPFTKAQLLEKVGKWV